MDVDDVRLAIQSRVNYSFTPPPPREVLLEMAAKKNSHALPLISDSFGIRLPPEKSCLLSLNYQIIPPRARPSQKNPAPASAPINATPSAVVGASRQMMRDEGPSLLNLTGEISQVSAASFGTPKLAQTIPQEDDDYDEEDGMELDQ